MDSSDDRSASAPSAIALSTRTRAIAALVIVNAMWGASFPIMKLLNLQIDDHFGVTEMTASTWLRTSSAAWMIAMRFLLALVLFVVVFPSIVVRVRREHWIAGATIGSFFFTGLLLQVIGLGSIPASRSGFLTSLAVVFTPILSMIYRKRLPRFPAMAGAVVALLGVSVLTGVVIVEDGQIGVAPESLGRWTWGDTLTILAAVFFSVQIICVDTFGKRCDSIAITPVMFATVVLLGSLTFIAIQGQAPETQTSSGWIELAAQSRFIGLVSALSLFPSLFAFAMMNKYQPSVSAAEAAVIYTLEPLMALLWAMCLPGLLALASEVVYANETFSSPLLIGGTLVLAANAMALWPGNQRNSMVPAEKGTNT